VSGERREERGDDYLAVVIEQEPDFCSVELCLGFE
jgi:hypothetical protein